MLSNNNSNVNLPGHQREDNNDCLIINEAVNYLAN